MSTARLGGPLCLLCLSWICSRFSYEEYFDLKYNLYVAFMFFSSLNILTLSTHGAVALDQIVRPRDIDVETSQIFTVFVVAEELAELTVSVVVFFTADDKISAAYAQIPSLVIFPVTVYFLFATHSRTILVSPPIVYHGAFKAIGCAFEYVFRFLAKILCRSSDPASFKISADARKNCKKFFALQIALVCIVPYFYFVDGVQFCLNCLEPVEPILRVRSPKELYQRVITATTLILVLLFVVPQTYKRKKGFFRLPVRRLYFAYLAVGVLGTVAFCMVIWDQKVGPERFFSGKVSSISLFNMLNSTTTAVIEQSKVLQPVHIPPYGRHFLTFDEPVDYLNVEFVNAVHFIEDYVFLGVEGHTSYVLTAFGLEKLEGIEQNDGSTNPTKSIVNIICLMVICKGRGYVLIDCGGNFVVRPELVWFGKKVRLEVTRDSNCVAKLLTSKGGFISKIEFKADSRVITLAAVDHNDSIPYYLVRMDGSQQVPFDEWALLPLQVLTEVVHRLFFVALAQFLLVTAPKALLTTTIASVFFYRFLAHVLISVFLCENGSFSAINCYIAIATFVVSVLTFIYATTKFARYTLRSDLSPAESLDKARIHPRSESIASNTHNPETRSIPSASSQGERS